MSPKFGVKTFKLAVWSSNFEGLKKKIDFGERVFSYPHEGILLIMAR